MRDGREDEGLLDVAYTTVDSPVGKLLLAATPKGLVHVAYAREDRDRVLADLAVRLSPRVLHAPKRLGAAARELDEYCGLRRKRFDLDLDLSLSRGFRQLVQRHLPEIGCGQTRSYTELAALVGNPTAIRAVGSAARPTRCPSSSRATGCCAPTEPSAGTSGDTRRRRPCCARRLQRDCLGGAWCRVLASGLTMPYSKAQRKALHTRKESR